MESLTGHNNAQVNLSSKADDPLDKNKIERVTLSKDESEKMNQWLSQIKAETSGFLEVSKSDLVNFLIRSHSEHLKVKEIKSIKSQKYDLVKHLNWLTPLLKKAIEENDQEKIFLLHAELKALEVKTGMPIKDKSIEPITKKSKKLRVKKSELNHSEDKNELNSSKT